LAAMESHGLSPAPAATPEQLLRRVWLDLTGLPPTPDEFDALAHSAAPDRYERVVDRLLSSPQYGERWARHWLDLVRYAERDYFRLQAFFAPAEFRREHPVPTAREKAIHEESMALYDQQTHASREAIAQLDSPYRQRLWEAKLGLLSEDAQLAHERQQAATV